MFARGFFPATFYEPQYFPERGSAGGGHAKAVGGMVLARMLNSVNDQWQQAQMRRVQQGIEARLLVNQLAYQAEVNFQKAMVRAAADTVVLLDL